MRYEELYLKSIEIEKNLQAKGVAPQVIRGRFKDYQNEVKKLDVAWKEKQVKGESEGIEFGGQQVFALKELREIVEVLEPLIDIYDTLPEESKRIVKEKIEIILTGPTYLIDEGGNTKARNYQFEFRLTAKFISAGYEVYFLNNPDIVIKIKGRKYAIECKRVTGTTARSIQTNIESAVDQLMLHKSDYYAGIIALDVSALLDRRTDILLSSSRELASEQILNDVQKMIMKDFERSQKVRRYANSHLVAMLYNFSGSYSIPNTNEVGWGQGTGILLFSENPTKMEAFNEDFAEYRNGSSSE
jgi:hypothetical protein